MKKYLPPLLLLAVCFILYSRTIGFNFLDWDDPEHIVENPFFHPVTLNSFKEIWIQPYAKLYIPVTYSLWGIITWISQIITGNIKPVFFHCLNILTHTLNVILVYLLIRNLLQSRGGRNQWAAFFGACLFAFHPMQSAAVAWVSGFKDLIMTTFGLLALLFYLSKPNSAAKPVKNRLNLHMSAWTSFGFYLMALLSKPSSVIFSGNAWLLGHTQPKQAQKPWWYLGLWVLGGAIIILITRSAQPMGALTLIPFWQKPLIALDSLGFYISKIFWPLGLAADHGRTPTYVLEDAPTWFMYLPIVIGSIIWIFHKSLPKDFPKALAFFLIALLPISGFIQFTFQSVSSVADYYIYFPMIGIAWALALLMQAYWRRSTVIALSCVIVILIICSWTHLPNWKNDESFYLSTFQSNPQSSIANEYLGLMEINRGDFPKARDYLSVALKLRRNISSLSELAFVLDHLNQLGEIEDKLQAAIPNIIKLKPQILASKNESNSAANIGSLLAKIYTSRRDYQSAIPLLSLAVEFTPENDQIHYQLAQLYENTSNTAQANAEFRRACDLQPTNTVYLKRCH